MYAITLSRPINIASINTIKNFLDVIISIIFRDKISFQRERATLTRSPMSYVDHIRNADPVANVRELMARVYDEKNSLPNDLFAWLSAFAQVQHDRLQVDSQNDHFTMQNKVSLAIEFSSTMIEKILLTPEADARLKECAINVRGSDSPRALLGFGLAATCHIIIDLTTKRDNIENVMSDLKRMQDRVRVSRVTRNQAIKFRCEELNISYNFFRHSNMSVAQILHSGEDEAQFYRDYLQWMRAEAAEKHKVFCHERLRVHEEIKRKRATSHLLHESLAYLQQCNALERM